MYCSFCMLLAIWCLCALMTALAMLIHNRAASVTAGILLSLGLIFTAAALENRLEEPEEISRYILINDYGKPIEAEQQPNLRYLSGKAREIYQWALDIHPIGQAIQISNTSGEHPQRWPFCSVGVFAVISGIAGDYFSCRENLFPEKIGT